MTRKFHHTTYPFDNLDVSVTISAADIHEGDWIRILSGEDYDHYYRVTFVNREDPRSMAVHFHGVSPKSYFYNEQVIVVRDPNREKSVPQVDLEEPIQAMKNAIDEIDGYIREAGEWAGDRSSIPLLLDTKANLLIAITEAR